MELYEHNLRPFNELKGLKKGESAVYVTATGTGKSYVAGKLIEESNERVLVVTPRKTISRQWRGLLAEHMHRVDVCTYQKLSMLKPQNYRKTFKPYGFVVLDEVHHAGAKSWGKPVNYCIKHAGELGVSVLGLTADPVRYTDGGYDVGKEMFGSDRVDGLMLEEAIEQKVLPEFNYVSALYEFPEDIKNASKNGAKVSKGRTTTLNRLLGRLNIGSDNLARITDIVLDNVKVSQTPINERHVVIFVASVDDFANAKRFARKIGLKNIYELSYKLSQKKNDAALDMFEKADGAALICVDMLNEGVHCKAVDTVVMLRRTSSPSIFFQQLGRALDSGSKKDIWVFDFVANAKSLNISSTFGDEKLSPVSHTVRRCCAQKITKDYATACLDVIHEIRMLLADHVPWTEQEDNILRTYFVTEGGKCFGRLENRTEGACYKRVAFLGLHSPSAWSEEETEILRKYYSTEGVKVVERLPGKDKSQVANAVSRLGLKRDPVWSVEDDEIMRKYYQTEGTSLAGRLSKQYTKRQITSHAITLGLKKDTLLWTEEEDENLRRYYPDKEKVLSHIKGRTWTGIVKRASVLGISVSNGNEWSIEELNYLRENAGKVSDEEIAKHLGRTSGSVRARRQKLGIYVPTNAWTKEEYAKLCKLYPRGSWKELLKALPGRSKGQIKIRASRLGVKRLIVEK